MNRIMTRLNANHGAVVGTAHDQSTHLAPGSMELETTVPMRYATPVFMKGTAAHL
jgi:hypothetical protein